MIKTLLLIIFMSPMFLTSCSMHFQAGYHIELTTVKDCECMQK